MARSHLALARTSARWRRRTAGVVTFGLSLAMACAAAAQQRGAGRVRLPGPSDAPAQHVTVPPTRGPVDFKSRYFLIHTDLTGKEARDLLLRLETMLELISDYWGQPPMGRIECYVVKDLAAWPEGTLPAEGLHKIRQGAGMTVVETLNRGRQTLAAKAIVYAKYGVDSLVPGDAAVDRGTPQHEAVHAYCGQAFGHTGPLWYAEGMAEMGRYWQKGDVSVRCDPIVVEYLRSRPPKPLPAILDEGGTNRTGDSWQNYAWRWALCHMLENNPNYSTRFRALGLGLLAGQAVRFGEAFEPVLAELSFEYHFFVTHLERGYRVDLCSWDWNRKFAEPGDSAIACRVAAQRGWQPSGVLVAADRHYDYMARGRWYTSDEGEELSADGRDDGTGQLEGIVLTDFTLSQAFSLSSDGSFTPPADGQLYLRCRDSWNELADNRGTIKVRIKQADGP